MLVNPYELKLATYGEVRLLETTLGIVGRIVFEGQRQWVVQGIYAPIAKRALGGVRVRVADKDDFVTFINQRDIEVLLGLGTPGTKCPWTESSYQAVGSSEWCGFCMDRDDLMDDLLERELFIRAENGGSLPYGISISRKLYMDDETSIEEELLSLWDMDVETGMSPDSRVSTVENRWGRTLTRRL